MRARNALQDWYSAEEARALGKRNASGALDPVIRSLFNARFQNTDATAAEGIALKNGLTGFEWLRTLLYRGRINEAKNAAEELSQTKLSESESKELYQETGRVAAFEGRWQEALDLTERALSSRPPGISQQALYQTRALCQFELGEMGRAASDIARALALATVYPNSTSTVYTRALQARVIARTNGVPAALDSLNRLWKELVERNDRITADYAIALLRAESDIRWLGGMDCTRAALPWYLIAEAAGERLYAALALVDLYYGSDAESRDRLEKLLTPAKSEFKRVSSLVAQIDFNDEDLSTSARTIRCALPSAKKSPTSMGQHLDLLSNWNILLLPYRGTQFQRQPCVGSPLSLPGQLGKAISLFRSSQSFEKEKLFHQIWGEQKYVSHLHENLIWTLLTRIKKSAGPVIGVSNGKVTLQDGVLVW